ncbi:hypothetical protein CHARACLAT_022761 [Characodon lateralis]|uniref:Uncharacterized protein n=1 Tax=Characodon lateralis TaxID=208331 RepID=A0ABU7F594_9TELE|nr:hypothetical protein [Characodon lateralis]
MLPVAGPRTYHGRGLPRFHLTAHRCLRVWRKARATLCKTSAVYARNAIRHRPQAPRHLVGQKVWLSTKDLPIKVFLVFIPHI